LDLSERAALTEDRPGVTVRTIPVLLGLGGLALLVVLWLLLGPALLLLAACVIAGYGLTHLFGLPLLFEERLAFGTVLGAITVTMAAFVAALAWGFGLPAVVLGMLAALALSAAGWYAGRKTHAYDLAVLRERWWRRPSSRGHPWPLALLLLICWPYTLKLLSQAYVFEPNGLYAGYVNIWGDWAAHLTYASSFAYSQNLPPQFSIDPGHNLGYPFMIDFLAASLTAFGTSLTSALVLSSGLLGLAFPAVLYLAARRLTGSHATAFVAVFVFALAGGLGFVRLSGDIDRLGLAALQHLPREYTLDRSQNYQLLDPVLAYLLPQRSTLFGLAAALIVVTGLWMARGRGGWRPYAFLGVATGLLPLFHVHAYGTVIALAGCWALLELRAPWPAFFAPALLIGVPELIWMWPPAAGGARFQLFWLANSDGHHDGFLWFWIKNTSLFIPLLVAAFAWRGTLSRDLALRLAPLWLWFLVPNFLVFQPWDWDNTKFFVFWLLFGSIAVGAVLARIGASTVEGRVLAGALVLVLCLSGALDLARALDLQVSSIQFTDPGGLRVAAWVRDNTSPSAVFLTSADHNEPVTALTGRRVVCGYPGWLYTYGLNDYFQRERDAYLMLSGQPGTDGLLSKYRVEYVVVGPSERNGDAHASDAYWSEHGQQVYSADGYSVYRVNSA
jgi:hypothetical protein